ncbi:MAG: hypothetical protein WC895_03695 [Candidatus Shapirobacteria bacterium]|jgi:uncharacterized membrane protein
MNLFEFLFKPNKYTVIGIVLLFLGFLLAPFIIGFFIMPIGAGLLVLGVHLSLYRLIPGHKQLTEKIINSYKPYFKKWKK